jgi:hypothetical protein
MKALYPFLVIALMVSLITSCSKKEPVSCFSFGLPLDTLNPVDTIVPGNVITFDATCSQEYTQLYWSFSDKKDSVYTGTILYRSFDSVGTYGVKLRTILGGRESVKIDSVRIQ